MTDGDDTEEDGAPEDADAGAEAAEASDQASAIDLSAEELESQLEAVAEDLEAAETEADLDDVEDELDAVADKISAALLPEPEDEDEEDPQASLEDRVGEIRDTIEAARGPYITDVAERLEGAVETVESGEWTEAGEVEAVEAVGSFLNSGSETLETDLGEAGEGIAEAASALSAAAKAVGGTDLDPDEDAEPIADLLDAADDLADGLDAAEEWADLSVREQLDAEGFYDVLNPENRKDFPAEWNAIKLYADRGEPEHILTALDRFESDFMEENALDALETFAPAEAFDALHSMAQKRAKQPIRILGRIGDERACDTLHDFLGGGDVELEKITLRALGSIGNPESTQYVANRLDAEDAEVRSVAARSLGLLGDTRAIEPLATVLAEDDADEVRASAAWALNQIGTEHALAAAADYADDRSYIVQAEAEKAAGA